MNYIYTSFFEEDHIEKAQLSVSNIFMVFDRNEQNMYSSCHGSIMDLIDSDISKRNRYVELLLQDSGTAFITFCAENNIEIPEPPAEEPIIEEQPQG